MDIAWTLPLAELEQLIARHLGIEQVKVDEMAYQEEEELLIFHIIVDDKEWAQVSKHIDQTFH